MKLRELVERHEQDEIPGLIKGRLRPYLVESKEDLAGCPVLLDPSKEEFLGLMRRSDKGHLRGILAHDENQREHLIVWSAYYLTHLPMIHAMQDEWGWTEKSQMEFGPAGRELDHTRSWQQWGPIQFSGALSFERSPLGQSLARSPALQESQEQIEVLGGARSTIPTEVRLLVNPTPQQVVGLMNRIISTRKYRAIRMIIDLQSNIVYAWDGYLSTHDQMIKALARTGIQVPQDAHVPVILYAPEAGTAPPEPYKLLGPFWGLNTSRWISYPLIQRLQKLPRDLFTGEESRMLG